MKIHSPAALVKSSALVVAIVGGMMLGAPKSAEAAPAMAPVEAVAPAADLTEVRYHGRHWHRHGHHHRRHFGHHRGRHFGHHHGRRHHYHGRRFRY
ncbi:MAG: hypothetical protein K2Y56_23785 [Methylobacterium sp.]|uniref:hypothetical protein n=1 Tax=Methylobacterium sp. TaxID=409 RepID=UPI0025E36FE8|nr:hypothetical protein [Methylobacterium sp.]MBX9934499.1 hypothetical protein [Methylobacterium sp.]